MKNFLILAATASLALSTANFAFAETVTTTETETVKESVYPTGAPEAAITTETKKEEVTKTVTPKVEASKTETTTETPVVEKTTETKTESKVTDPTTGSVTEVKTEEKTESKTPVAPALVEPKKPEEPKAVETKKEEAPKAPVKAEETKKKETAPSKEVKTETPKKSSAKSNSTKKPVPLTQAEQDKILTKVQDHIRSIRTLKARFKQTAEVYSKDLTGTLYVMRPGRLRFEYDKPVNDYIVADGRFIYFYDSELKTYSHTLVSNTLAAFLVQEDADLFKGNVKVIDMVVNEATSKKMLGLTLVDGDEPEKGRLTLIFEQNPEFKLVKWQVVDANGYITQVELENIQKGIDLDKNLFKFIAPNIAKPGYN